MPPLTPHSVAWSLLSHHGLFAVPVSVTRSGDGAKRFRYPVKWGEFARGPFNETALERAWDGNEGWPGLALILGRAAGLFCVESDSPKAEEALRKLVTRTPTFRSARGFKYL